MAITNDGMDKAEVTYCYQFDVQRMADGSFAQTEICLPWAWVKFADPGEERRYLTTRTGDGVGLTVPGAQPYRQLREAMRFSPFPHEADRASKNSGPGNDNNVPGDYAIHFIGNV